MPEHYNSAAKKHKKAAPKMKHSSPTEMNHAAPTKNLKKGYHGVKPNPPANMGSAYKMKNSVLHMGAKHGTPIHANYGSPAKDLKGGQHKLDKNKDGKLSRVDFDMMNNSPADMYGKSPAKNKPIVEPGSGKSKIVYNIPKESGLPGDGELKIFKDDPKNMRTLVSSFTKVNKSNYPSDAYKQTDPGVGDVFIQHGGDYSKKKTS